MSSKTETVLAALRARLGSIPSVTVQRNSAVPETVPAGGLIILRDGDAGEPEQALGGSIESIKVTSRLVDQASVRFGATKSAVPALL